MKKVLVVFSTLAMFACNPATDAAKTEVQAETSVPAASGVASVILPAAECKPLQDAIQAYADGNLDAFLAGMDDNVKIYYPGPGDSLVGKQALTQFFKTRQDSVVSAEALNPVYMAMDNKEVNNGAAPGKWLMAWYQWKIKYKNGKTAQFPLQITQHMNAAGKVDMGIWYYDMAKAFGNK